MKHCLLLITAILLAHVANAQKKFERETRIKSAKVAEKARTYVESLFPDSKKIKWYLEENLEGVTIEAKLKENRSIYSIEFDTLGTLHDIERTQKFDQLPMEVQGNVTAYLKKRYKSFKIKKIQIQWTGDPDVLHALIRKGDTDNTFTTNYEIVYTGREDKDTASYESLFDRHGKHIETKEIIERNLNHLLY
ncbi:hypothetical protein [Olivibacter ginsenosidimutans]